MPVRLSTCVESQFRVFRIEMNYAAGNWRQAAPSAQGRDWKLKICTRDTG
jgi:hypothetical protein